MLLAFLCLVTSQISILKFFQDLNLVIVRIFIILHKSFLNYSNFVLQGYKDIKINYHTVIIRNGEIIDIYAKGNKSNCTILQIL